MNVAKWQVKMTGPAEAELKALLKNGSITKSDVKVLLRWVDEMEELGPDHIAAFREWHDHELDRKWKGFRSSAFCSQGRVIYRIEDNKIIVEVHRVTTDHNYKK